MCQRGWSDPIAQIPAIAHFTFIFVPFIFVYTINRVRRTRLSPEGQLGAKEDLEKFTPVLETIIEVPESPLFPVEKGTLGSVAFAEEAAPGNQAEQAV